MLALMVGVLLANATAILFMLFLLIYIETDLYVVVLLVV